MTRTVSVSKSKKNITIHTQVPTVVVADVGQSGPKGATGSSGVFVGTLPPSDTTLLWVDIS